MIVVLVIVLDVLDFCDCVTLVLLYVIGAGCTWLFCCLWFVAGAIWLLALDGFAGRLDGWFVGFAFSCLLGGICVNSVDLVFLCVLYV